MTNVRTISGITEEVDLNVKLLASKLKVSESRIFQRAVIRYIKFMNKPDNFYKESENLGSQLFLIDKPKLKHRTENEIGKEQTFSEVSTEQQY